MQTEFQSIQIMTRFMWEILGSGDPLDVYAGAADAIMDEIRHTAMCVEMAKALGAEVTGVASARNDAFVKELGADHMIAYETTDPLSQGPV